MKIQKSPFIYLALLLYICLLSACNKDENTNEVSACGITETDALGPYFVAGTPLLQNINNLNLPGTAMFTTGSVFGGTDNTLPLQKAKIDIWHTDNDGNYHPEGAGNVTDYSAEEIGLRAYVLSDEKGNFSYESIYPGLYDTRARHIHYKITAEGYKTLVTQGYFAGDERLETDAGARAANDCRIIDYTLTDGMYNGKIDFYLEPN